MSSRKLVKGKAALIDRAGRRCLVCVMGTGSYQETTYVLDGQGWRTRYAPIAVGRLAFGEGAPVTVIALLTGDARTMHGESFEQLVREAGWDYCPVDIPDGRSEEELWRIFQALGEQLRLGDEVILDPTHGFRSLPLILLSALQYYRIQKGLNLVKVYYGAYQPGAVETPVFDLTPIIGLADWTYGVKIFKDHRIAAPLGEQLEQLQISAHKDASYPGRKPTRLQKVGRGLRALDPPLRYGLPIEAGWLADELLANAEAAEEELAAVPPMRDPWEEMKAQLSAIALPKRGRRGKRELPLTRAELDRQARLIEGYFEAENVWAALALVREWLVSVVVLRDGDGERWLEREPRERAPAYLYGLCRRRGDPMLERHDRALGEAWDAFSDARNQLAHAAMTVRQVRVQEQVARLRSAFEAIHREVRTEEFWSGA